jgi:hypothetical protein
MVIVRISYTMRSPHPSSKWTQVHDETQYHADMATARAALKDQFCHVRKRLPVYQDTVSRGTVQCGWIYCYKDKQWWKDSRWHTAYHQDWVTFLYADYRVVDVTKKED